MGPTSLLQLTTLDVSIGNFLSIRKVSIILSFFFQCNFFPHSKMLDNNPRRSDWLLPYYHNTIVCSLPLHYYLYSDLIITICVENWGPAIWLLIRWDSSYAIVYRISYYALFYLAVEHSYTTIFFLRMDARKRSFKCHAIIE